MGNGLWRQPRVHEHVIVTSRSIAAHMKQCIIFSPKRHHLSQRAAPLVKGVWLQPTSAPAPRNQKMRRTGMMSLSRPCQQCWPAGLSQTSPMPVPPLAGCLWKAIPPQTSLRVPKFLKGLPNRSLGESTLNEKQAAVSRVVPLLPHHSSPVRLRTS